MTAPNTPQHDGVVERSFWHRSELHKINAVSSEFYRWNGKQSMGYCSIVPTTHEEYDQYNGKQWQGDPKHKIW